MFVRFTDDVRVSDEYGETTFEAMAGDEKELAAPSARRWIRRNKAVEIPSLHQAKAAPKKAAPKKAAPKKAAPKKKAVK